MNENLTLEIKYFGRIHYANIKLNKINVVGGINSSGKSTASKLLYCFLKANTPHRLDHVKKEAIPLMNTVINVVANPTPFADHGLKDKFSFDDDFNEILEEYNKAKEKFQDIKHLIEIDDVIEYDIMGYADKLIKIIQDDGGKSSLKIVNSILLNESLDVYKGITNFYGDDFRFSIINGSQYFNKEMFFNANQYSNSSFEHFPEVDGVYSSQGDFDDITDVFYVDSFSILDMKLENQRFREHYQYVLNNLKDVNEDEDLDEDSLFVLEMIEGIIGGKFKRDLIEFSFSESNEDDYEYTSKSLTTPNKRKTDNFIMENTSSGIKQIGVIQLLIANNKLKPGTFLIIDEPEVNLHPNWQFKFAEILVLIAKELDVVVYINSHSPTFIESIDAFSEFYDFGDSINYYLTQEYKIQ